MYGASTEQVRSKCLLGVVGKMGKIEIKRKNNCDYGYKKKVYREVGQDGRNP